MRTASPPIIAVAAITFLMLLHLIFRAPGFPFAPDSAAYIEQARSLIQEGSALTTSYGPTGVGKSPSTLFPIGYPILLAFISMFGVDARSSSVALGWVSAILFPALLFISFRKLTGSTNAAILVGLSAFSPGMLRNAPIAQTDVFSLMLTVSAVGLVLNSRSAILFLVSGAIAGFAYAVRNAHIALLASFAIYFLYLSISDPSKRDETSKQALAFVAGASAIMLPLLIRNLTLFNALNPYEMAPSTLSVVHNVRTYIQELIYDVSAFRDIGIFAAWSIPGLVMVTVFVLVGSGVLVSSWGQLAENRKKTIFICVTYSVMGAIVVIAARSRYEWGEPINVRHTLQYTPFLLAAFLAIIPNPSINSGLSFARTFSSAIILFLAALHINYGFRLDNQNRLTQERSTGAINAYLNGKSDLCVSGENALLVSNWSYVFRIECDAPVIDFEFPPRRGSSKSSSVETTEGYRAMYGFLLKLSDKSASKPIRAGFFPGRGIGSGFLPLPKVTIANLQNAGWRIVQNNNKGLLLTF